MAWVRVRFDGGDLVLARLTRRHPRVRAYQAVGPPTPEQVYPAAIRVTGLSRLRTWGLLLAFQARFDQGTEASRVGRDLVVHVGIVRDRLPSEELKLLMLHEHRFDAPLLAYAGGTVTVYLQPRPGTDVAQLLKRLPGLDTEVLADVDTTPWHGLEPRIPDRRPILGLRQPPQMRAP